MKNKQINKTTKQFSLKQGNKAALESLFNFPIIVLSECESTCERNLPVTTLQLLPLVFSQKLSLAARVSFKVILSLFFCK